MLYEDMGGQGSGTRERGGWYGQRAGYKQGNIDTRPRRYDCIFLFSAFSWVLERGGPPSTGCPGWEMGFQASRNSLFLDENEKKWNWCFSCFRFVFCFFLSRSGLGGFASHLEALAFAAFAPPLHFGGWDAEWEDGRCWVGCDTWERWPFSRRQGMEREDELDVWLGFQSLCLTGAPGHTSKRALMDGTTLGYLAVPPLG